MSLEPCALNDEFQHLYPYLINFSYFADTTKRGVKGVKCDETLPIINKSKHPKKKGRNTRNKKEQPHPRRQKNHQKRANQ
jgi:hypothetical protein